MYSCLLLRILQLYQYFSLDLENSFKPLSLPSNEEILQKWLANRKSSSIKEEKVVESAVSEAKCVLPLELQSIEQSLPPSLKPPPPGGWSYNCNELADWG